MLGHAKRRVGARPRVEEDLRNSSSQGQALAIFWNSISVVNSSKKLPKSAPRCGGVDRNAHTLPHVRANGDGPVSWR